MYKRSIHLYLLDILDSSTAITSYVKDLDFQSFKEDRKTYMAVIKEFEIIGEAVSKLPKDLKKKYKNIQWQDIKDFRNILTHEYFGVDLEIVWKVIIEELPELISTVRKILETEKGDL